MPQKNPYLTQYKENISSQQKLIRQRLGQPADLDDNDSNSRAHSSNVRRQQQQPPHTSHLLESVTMLDNNGDFPSIDEETLEHVDGARGDQPGRVDRPQHQKSGYSYFDYDAEESLQFFKKNLLPTQTNLQSTQRTTAPTTTTTTNLDATTPKRQQQQQTPSRRSQQQRSTGSQFDRQPSLSSIRGESAYVAGSRAPLEMTETLRTTNTVQAIHPTNGSSSNNYKYKYPPVGSVRPPPSSAAKQQPKTSTPLADRLPPPPLPPVQARTRQPSGDRQSQRPPANSKLSDTGGDLRPATAADEVELARVLPRQSPRLPDSPIPAETFARKPLYNSLLRAHDSIRLKVNRPKVRPKSEGASGPPVEDTALDDTIELAEIGDSTQPAATSAAAAAATSTSPNERAVDVKRRSSRKKSKATSGSKKKDDEQTAGQLEAEAVPVRNFSEVRVVQVVRSESERSLGVTVHAQEGNIVVARILAGSLADKQGALQVGDIILAVNNREVYTPEQLQEQLRRTLTDDTVLLKIVPSFREELPTLCIYLRALFQYDPNEDSLLPCKEVGVAFSQGDILEVVNQEDPNWWQARRVDSENLQTGLIPSQELEERRRAFVLPDYDLATRTSICGTKVSRKSKKKEIYNVGQNCDFDKAELQLYEEVCRTPAFERRTLVLIGANGVGKQALKARLIGTDPDRFGTPLPHTSRLPRDGEQDGVHYHFVARDHMEEDIIAGMYLEYGEYDGALYGTKLDSVREIIGSGRVCVLDCSPTCLKVLKTSDYLPFVAFIAAPALDQLRYMHEYNRGTNPNKTYATFDMALSRQSRRAKTLQDFAFDFFEDEDLQVTVEESARLFRMYENYFDIVLVNNGFARTYEQLRDAIDALSMAPQWIPISWIYGT